MRRYALLFIEYDLAQFSRRGGPPDYSTPWTDYVYPCTCTYAHIIHTAWQDNSDTGTTLEITVNVMTLRPYDYITTPLRVLGGGAEWLDSSIGEDDTHKGMRASRE